MAADLRALAHAAWGGHVHVLGRLLSLDHPGRPAR
jgi:hypothetical protein